MHTNLDYIRPLQCIDWLIEIILYDCFHLIVKKKIKYLVILIFNLAAVKNYYMYSRKIMPGFFKLLIKMYVKSKLIVLARADKNGNSVFTQNMDKTILQKNSLVTHLICFNDNYIYIFFVYDICTYVHTCVDKSLKIDHIN